MRSLICITFHFPAMSSKRRHANACAAPRPWCRVHAYYLKHRVPIQSAVQHRQVNTARPVEKTRRQTDSLTGGQEGGGSGICPEL